MQEVFPACEAGQTFLGLPEVRDYSGLPQRYGAISHAYAVCGTAKHCNHKAKPTAPNRSRSL
jgi:hypothetical protein